MKIFHLNILRRTWYFASDDCELFKTLKIAIQKKINKGMQSHGVYTVSFNRRRPNNLTEIN
jgi:hypothetical protein